MAKRFFIFFIIICSTTIFAQKVDSSKAHIIGVIGHFDLAYNFPDKILTPGLQRKWTIGISFTNRKKEFIAYAAVGIKGAKIDLYSQSFRESFISDIQKNYVPINDTNESRAIGVKMNDGGKNLWGTYSQHAEIGFILNRKFRPSCSFYVGTQEFLLHDDSFKKYEDPEHGDINYVGMRATFYEFKIGCGLPFKAPFSVNLNIGYKWVNYGDIKFNNTPLSAYTMGTLKNRYSSSNGLTLSISFMAWSNWGISSKSK